MPNIEPIEPNIRIWRYMDFAKFVAMLQYKGLFFPTADQLGESYEGSLPHKLASNRENVIGTVLPEYDKFANDNLRKWICISCWHMNEFESPAMWQSYTRTKEAIAIQSTQLRLKQCLPTSIIISPVQYIDYDDPPSELNFSQKLTAFKCKRKYFEFERELRAIMSFSFEMSVRASSKMLPGSNTEIDTQHYLATIQAGLPDDLKAQQWQKLRLEELIECIYIAPTAPSWFSELTKQVVEQYGHRIEVKQSSLDKSPSF